MRGVDQRGIFLLVCEAMATMVRSVKPLPTCVGMRVRFTSRGHVAVLSHVPKHRVMSVTSQKGRELEASMAFLFLRSRSMEMSFAQSFFLAFLLESQERKDVLDAFFLGKALAETINEKLGEALGEFISQVNQSQAEQREAIRQLQVCEKLVLGTLTLWEFIHPDQCCNNSG